MEKQGEAERVADIQTKLAQYETPYLYGVILEDGGQNGEVVGCGDSLVPAVYYTSENFKNVKKGMVKESHIADVIRALFITSNESIGGADDNEFGNGVLYTAAHQPDLTVEGIETNGDTANVFMSGTITLGGACDTPRFVRQLEKTAIQFEGIDYARFYLDGSEAKFQEMLSSQ